MGRKGYPRKLALLLLSTIVCLGLAELLVRWLELEPAYAPPASFALNLFHEDPNGPVRLTPGWQGDISGVWTTINEKGFRDSVFAAEPAPGTRRIAVFGDSYTMGDGVPLESSYPKQLGRVLREAGVDGEVMNCAVSATNSRNQLATVREVVEEYHLDFAILGYNLNDFDNPTQTRFESWKAAGRSMTVDDEGRVTLHEAPRSWSRRARFAVYERSYLYRYVKRLLERSGTEPEERVAMVERWLATGDHLLSFDAVAEMKAVCEAKSIPFLVVILPDQLRLPRTVRDYADYPFAEVHATILEQLTVRGVECFDLVPELAGHDPHELEVHRTDPHFNHEGNRLVAEFLAGIASERL